MTQESAETDLKDPRNDEKKDGGVAGVTEDNGSESGKIKVDERFVPNGTDRYEPEPRDYREELKNAKLLTPDQDYANRLRRFRGFT